LRVKKHSGKCQGTSADGLAVSQTDEDTPVVRKNGSLLCQKCPKHSFDDNTVLNA